MREFSPAREEEVTVMQQVTEIYGRENGWVHSSVKYIRRASEPLLIVAAQTKIGSQPDVEGASFPDLGRGHGSLSNLRP